jgi:hypothetical protein
MKPDVVKIDELHVKRRWPAEDIETVRTRPAAWGERGELTWCISPQGWFG